MDLQGPLEAAIGAPRRAADKYRQIFNESVRASRIDVALRVDADAMARLTRVGDADIFDRACNYQVNLLFKHGGNRDDFIEDAKAYPPAGGSVIAFIREIGDIRSEDSARDKYNIAVFGQTVSAKTGDRTRRLVRTARHINERADHLIRTIAGIRQIDGIVAEIDASSRSPFEKADEIAKRASRINDDINDSLREWIYARGPISGLFTESVPRLTVAFLGMIAELLGSEDPLLMPIVSVDRGRKHTLENRDLAKETWIVI